MGNCINLMQSSQKNLRVLVSNGGEEKFKASTKVRKIISGYDLVHFANPNAKLLPSEVYDQLSLEVVENVGCKESLKVKIVLTRKQLEFLVRNAKDFQIRKINPKTSRHIHSSQKWRPSLATIQE